MQVRNEPVVAGELKRILQGDGATLSIRDASGAVSLTVAGQAKVQAVYNTLKLSETFDEKRFANAGVAQAVTLVAAVALTMMTGGASIGVALAGQAGTAATVINAGVVAMASTMTGQLAGDRGLVRLDHGDAGANLISRIFRCVRRQRGVAD